MYRTGAVCFFITYYTMCLSYNICQYFADFLWLPCVADADIIFLSFFYLLFFLT